MASTDSKWFIIVGVMVLCAFMVIPVMGVELNQKQNDKIIKENPILLTKTSDIQLIDKSDISKVSISPEGNLNWTHDHIKMLWTPNVIYPEYVNNIKTKSSKATIITQSSVVNNKISTTLSEDTKIEYQLYPSKVKETIVINKPTERIYYDYSITNEDEYKTYIYYFPNSTEQTLINDGKMYFELTKDNGSEIRSFISYPAKENPVSIEYIDTNSKYTTINDIPAKGGILISINGEEKVFYQRPIAIDAENKIYQMDFLLNQSTHTLDIIGILENAVYPIFIDPTGNTVSTSYTLVNNKVVVKWIFASSGGDTSWTVPSGITEVSVLVVGGGGGGAWSESGAGGGGGGGSGGIVYNASYAVSGTVNNLFVGGGGTFGGDRGTNGTASTFGNIISNGGGGGAATAYGYNGGSGGGGTSGINSFSPGGNSTQSNSWGTGYGNKGGDGVKYPSNYCYDGAGGGAGGAGGSGGGAGGIGISSSITGTETYYGGGGGAGDSCQNGVASLGGLGGGGKGSNWCSDYATAGTDGLGGGGGGAYACGDSGRSGGSGVIIIQYNNILIPSFSQNVSGNQRPLYPDTSGVVSVSFTDTTSGTTATGWDWKYTDRSGNNTPITFSTSANPIKSFNNGNFSIRLTSSGGGYTNTTAADTYWINVSNPLPVASFTKNSTGGNFPLHVQFTDTSYGSAAWYWVFSDGSWSTYKNASYIFNNNGTYQVNLTSYNIYGESNTAATQSITVTDPPKTFATFTTNKTSGNFPLHVQFTSNKTLAVAYNWSFGDGSWSTFSDASYVFNNNGTYNVSLTSYNFAGWSNTTTTPITVTDPPKTIASFTTNITTGAYPLAVQFTPNTTLAVAYNWSFGENGSWSTYQNPIYIYNNKGLYNVSLTTYNFAGWDNTTPTTTQINVYDPSLQNWTSSKYNNGDTGTVLYSIDSAYWNPSSYTYSITIYDSYSNIKAAKAITTISGYENYIFDAINYPIGYYFAYVTRTRILPGATPEVMGIATTQVVNVIRLTGYVFNAENGTLLNANVSIIQNTTSKNEIASTGFYDTNLTIFSTGTLVLYNTTLAGFQQDIQSFIPLSSKTYIRNITMIPLNPTHSGISLGGAVYEPPYSSPVPNATATLTNSTTTLTTTTNAYGYYIFNNLKHGNYSLMFSKNGYDISAVHTVVV